MTVTVKQKRHLQVAREVTRLYESFDEAVEEHKPASVTCTRGCTACCYQVVGMTVSEAAVIYVRHKKLVEEQLERLREDSKQMDEILIKLGIDPYRAPPPNEPPIMIGPAKQALCDAWWRLFKPCPFLDEKSRDCRIYDARPGACRSYFVTTDPVLCEAEEGTDVTVWTINQEELALRLAHASARAGVSVLSLGPMADVILHVRKEMRG